MAFETGPALVALGGTGLALYGLSRPKKQQGAFWLGALVAAAGGAWWWSRAAQAQAAPPGGSRGDTPVPPALSMRERLEKEMDRLAGVLSIACMKAGIPAGQLVLTVDSATGQQWTSIRADGGTQPARDCITAAASKELRWPGNLGERIIVQRVINV